MNNTIIKPISMLKDDYLNALVNITNDSGLPLFVAEYILRDFISELHVASEKQYNVDVQTYNSKLSATDEKSD